jgi:uncharacterized membrane protein
MISKLLYAILLTLMPVTELRVGLPLAISYAIENNIPIFLIFLLIISVNILLIFFVFYFLDKIHSHLMKIKFYKNIFQKFLKRFQKKVDKFEEKHGKTEFWALALFVAVPLPGTGAWSGCLLAWILDLNRKRSILAISLGVIIAGIIILIGSLGFVKLFNML